MSEEEYFREITARIRRCQVYYPPQRRVRNKMIDVSAACVEVLSGMLSRTKYRWTLSQIRESEWLADVTDTEDVYFEESCGQCWQTEGDIRNILSRARLMSTEEAIFGLAPQAAQSIPAFELLVRISEVGSELSNPTTPEPSSHSMPTLVPEDLSPVYPDILSCTP